MNKGINFDAKVCEINHLCCDDGLLALVIDFHGKFDFLSFRTFNQKSNCFFIAILDVSPIPTSWFEISYLIFSFFLSLYYT